MIFLEAKDINILTGYKQKSQQKRMLNRMSIPYLENAIGDLIISKEYVEARLGCRSEQAVAETELPRFDLIHGQKAKR